MLKYAPSIGMIEIVAASLQELLPDVVFVGGATAPFYIEDEGIQETRPTDDVDCIIEIANRAEYYSLENKLRSKGFRHSVASNAPICRWKINEITVDMMPTNKEILGFSNRWYKEGIQNAIQVQLPSKRVISIFSLPYFIASKIEAYHGRGNGDFRSSHDIEDVVTVLDGQKKFDSIEQAPDTVSIYLKETFENFINDSNFLESLSGHLEKGPSNVARTKRLLNFIENFSKNPTNI